jgi:hypothetical protein
VVAVAYSAADQETVSELLRVSLSDERSADDRAVASHILDLILDQSSGEISDGVARTIASWWSGGQASVSYRFVSTGAISTHLFSDLAGDVYPSLPLFERRCLDWLGTYLLNRDDTGPVEGWEMVWCR